MSAFPIIAVDIGNARIKLGLFAPCCADGLPEPAWTLPLLGNEPELDMIEDWLETGNETPRACEHAPYRWWIASVNRPAATRLIDWLCDHRPGDRVTLLAAGDLPLEVRLERPDMVGIDRLVDAVAVNRLRRPERPAVIVDVGTAITVDLVSADGAFLGGAILPGLQMSARAMHEFTDLLPLVEVSEPPPALGKSTTGAIQSGLYWGAIGAVKELVAQLSGDRDTEIFLTGGAGPLFANVLSTDSVRPPIFVPHLTLAGVALAAAAVLPAEPPR